MKFLVVFMMMISLPLSAKQKFSVKKIKIGNAILKVEMAETEPQRQQGLMFRKSLASDAGMLFVFEQEEPLSFWMKNTFIPLSIGFFDQNKKLVDVQDMTPMKTIMDKHVPSYQAKHPAKYALEVNQGWFKKNKVKLGQKFEFID